MKVLETKSRQTLMFDPDDSTGRLRTCPFLGGWCALLCGEVFVWVPDGTRLVHFLAEGRLELYFPREVKATCLRRTYCGRSLFLRGQAGLNESSKFNGTRLYELRG